MRPDEMFARPAAILLIVVMAIFIGIFIGANAPSPASSTAVAISVTDDGVTNSRTTFADLCRQPRGHDDADLCEQWRAAEAATQAASWAWWQVLVGLASIIGLIVTLAVALQGNGLTRRNAVIQSRAYLHGTAAEMWPHPVGSAPATALGLQTTWTNVGDTPAHRCTTFSDFQIISAADAMQGVRLFSHAPRGEIPNAPRPNIPPTGAITSTIFIDARQLPDVAANRLSIVFYSGVHYFDAFGEPHFASVCYRLFFQRVPQTLNDPQAAPVIFNTYPFHNEYDPAQ